MNLADAKVAQLLIPVDDFERAFTDPDGNQLALMSEVPQSAA